MLSWLVADRNKQRRETHNINSLLDLLLVKLRIQVGAISRMSICPSENHSKTFSLFIQGENYKE